MSLAALFLLFPFVFDAAFALPGCALRGVVSDATMTTPDGAGTPPIALQLTPCSAHRLLSWGRSSYRTPARGSHSSLCPAPVPIGHPYILWCWIKMQTRGCSYYKLMFAVLAGAFH
jgi:hypothetical protein